MDKSTFTAKILSAQPRIRLTRSFDESSHTYLGYAVFLQGTIGDEEREFCIDIGKAAPTNTEPLPWEDICPGLRH